MNCPVARSRGSGKRRIEEAKKRRSEAIGGGATRAPPGPSGVELAERAAAPIGRAPDQAEEPGLHPTSLGRPPQAGLLEDTIDEQSSGGGNGFKFWGYDPNELMSALERALGTFKNKDEWTRMMRRGMEQDFSWEKPAHEYVRVYERVIQNRSS